MIQIHSREADLSRRIQLYRLANLSFREYLEFKDIATFERYALDDIALNHVKIANEIAKKIKLLAHFQTYLNDGAYPFMLNSDDNYAHLLLGVINQMLEVDLPHVTNINYAQIDKIKKLIYLLSTTVPLKPNISKLSESVEVSRPTLMEYIHYLELGSLVSSVNQKARGYKVISKPDKLYLYNTNLMKAISQNIDKGTQRETFFVNQIKSSFYNQPSLIDDNLLLANSGDFLVKNRYIFEAGGKNKGLKQIKDLKDSFVLADDIEVGFGNKIPLWLFGFLY